MLYTTDTNNVRTTGMALVYRETGGEAGVLVTVTGRAVESDTALTRRYLSATLQWNDGTGAAVSFGTVSLDDFDSGYWEITATKRLSPGQYVAVLQVQNYKSPKEEVVRLNFFITVTAAKPVYNPPRLIYGPILPRDAGFPNAGQWDFNIDSDLIVLESSVKMLLLTAKGDRLMEPDYGTNIRRLLFELNIPSIESLIREEIISAFARWEPRVQLVNLNASLDPTTRSASLDMTLVSKLNKQVFETQVQFNR